ncbi:MAG: iron-containing alcohol dehydrogenase [Pyrodictiaceae archaeon]
MFIVLPRTIYYAEATPDAVRHVTDQLSARRILVVTDKIVASLKQFQEVIASLSRDYEIRVFDEVESEPSIETARRVAEEASKHSAEVILAIGGGSVIDAAKAGLVLYENPSIDLESISPFTPIGVGRKAKLIAVPTTSGTGSDASFGVVLTKRENGRRKLALGSYELVPYATILDIEFTKTMPRELTRNTAVDALSHAVEAYVAVMSNPFTDSLAEKTVEIIFKHLPILLKDPGNEDSRRALHLAATMAGIAFTNAGLGLAHAIAHAVGPKLGLHHGLVVGLILPHIVEFNSSRDSNVRSKYARLSKIVEEYSGRQPQEDFRAHLISFYRDIGHPYRISHLPSPPSKDEWEKLVPEMAEKAMEDPELAFNPVPVAKEDIEGILKKIY